MDNVNMDVFHVVLDICLFCVGSGLVVGFILRFLIYGISAIWSMFQHITLNERG